MYGFALSPLLHLHYMDMYAYICTEEHRGPKIITENFPRSFEPSCFALNWEQDGWEGLGLQVWQEGERQDYEEAG